MENRNQNDVPAARIGLNIPTALVRQYPTRRINGLSDPGCSNERNIAGSLRILYVVLAAMDDHPLCKIHSYRYKS